MAAFGRNGLVVSYLSGGVGLVCGIFSMRIAWGFMSEIRLAQSETGE